MLTSLEYLKQNPWRDEFDRGALSRGQDYARERRVTLLSCATINRYFSAPKARP